MRNLRNTGTTGSAACKSLLFTSNCKSAWELPVWEEYFPYGRQEVIDSRVICVQDLEKNMTIPVY